VTIAESVRLAGPRSTAGNLEICLRNTNGSDTLKGLERLIFTWSRVRVMRCGGASHQA
jgi:hypothetical protein